MPSLDRFLDDFVRLRSRHLRALSRAFRGRTPFYDALAKRRVSFIGYGDERFYPSRPHWNEPARDYVPIVPFVVEGEATL